MKRRFFRSLTARRPSRLRTCGRNLGRIVGLFLGLLVIYFLAFPLSLPTLSPLDQPPIIQKANGHFVFQKVWAFDVDGERFEIPINNLSNGITARIEIKEWLGGNAVDSSATRAAIIHDWFILRTRVNRFRVDQIFYAALRQGDTPWWKQKLMYHCVSFRSLQHRINGVRHPGKNAPPWHAPRG